MTLDELLQFLLKARIKTYAGDSGKVETVFKGSDQLEYEEGDFFYRDVYYTGKDKFNGIEVIYYKGKPAWSMVYHGNWSTMTEEEIDRILRGALIANADITRINKQVEWSKDNFVYRCDGKGTIDELYGIETITKDSKQVYRFDYKGGIIAKN